MKVLLVSPSCSRVGCGVGDHAAGLAGELAARDCEVHLATDPAGNRRRDLPPRVAVHTVLERHTLREVRALARWARDLAPDLVHIQYQVLTYSGRGAILTLPGMLRGRTRVVVTMHDFLLPYLFRGAGPLRRKLLGAFVGRADGVVVASAAHRAQALAAGARADSVRDFIMPSNVDLTPLSAEREARLDERFAIAGRTLLLAFGAVSLGSGADLLLRALARVPAASRRRLRCLLVGGPPAYASDPGGELRAVEDLARELGLEDCLRVTGYLAAEHVSGLLQMCRAVIQPRQHAISPMSTAVATALLHRRPLLAVGGAERLDARLPAAAIHFSAPVPEALAAALTRLAAGDTLWPPGADEALRVGAHRFSWRHVADQHCALYGEIARRPPGPVSGG
jgi:glycosyltransferase involved in cell wall biosynthesis